jgi:CheY-like chemotaxis protein
MSDIHALIIDDNRENVDILAELLTLEGVGFTRVDNPTQLEDRIQGINALDIIFLDLEMPKIDGFQLLELFHTDPRFDGVPVVAYTVHVSEINVARQVGFHSFLGKPLDADMFPEYLSRILNGERVWVG